MKKTITLLLLLAIALAFSGCIEENRYIPIPSGLTVRTACGDTNQVLLGTGECVAYIPSATYYPSSVKTVYGTDFNNNDLNAISYYDNNLYTVREATGTPGLQLDVNFSGVSTFSSITMKEQFDDGGQEITVSLFDYDTNTWETYTAIDSSAIIEERSITVGDPADHVENGLVQLRFLYSGSGNQSYYFFVDYVWLQSGTVVSSQTHNSLPGIQGGAPGDYQHMTAQQIASFGAVGDEYFVWDEINKWLLIGAIDTPLSTLDVRGTIFLDGGDYGGDYTVPFPGNDNIVFGDWGEGCIYWTNEGYDDYEAHICNAEGVLTTGTELGYSSQYGNYYELSTVSDNWGEMRMNEEEGVIIEHPVAGRVQMNDVNGIIAETPSGASLQLSTDGSALIRQGGGYFLTLEGSVARLETDGDDWGHWRTGEEEGIEWFTGGETAVMNFTSAYDTNNPGLRISSYADSGPGGGWNWVSTNMLNVVGDVNASGANGFVNADTNFQVGGVAGITDNTNYWLCTASDCSTTCQVTIKGGIITNCA